MTRLIFVTGLSLSILFLSTLKLASAESACAEEYRLSTNLIVVLTQYEHSLNHEARDALWQQAIRLQRQKVASDERGSSRCDRDTYGRYEVGSGMYNYLKYRHGEQPNEVQMNINVWLILQATAEPTYPPDYLKSLGHFTQIPGFTPDFYRSLLRKVLLMYRDSHTELDLDAFNLRTVHAREKLTYWLPDENLSP